MPSALRPTFLRRFAGTLRPPAAPDPADMGTAFGLDHCLDEAVLPPEPAGSPPREADAGLSWLARFGRKRAGPA